MLRNDQAIRILNAKQIYKGLAQLRVESQRAAAEEYFFFNIPAPGQGGDYLQGNRIKYGGSNIFPGYMAAKQCLYIGLGKDAAAGGNRVNVR